MSNNTGYALTAKDKSHKEVGKTIKSSKTRTTWHLGVGAGDAYVSFVASSSRKRTVKVNKEVVFDKKIGLTPESKKIKFEIGSYETEIVPDGELINIFVLGYIFTLFQIRIWWL